MLGDWKKDVCDGRGSSKVSSILQRQLKRMYAKVQAIWSKIVMYKEHAHKLWFLYKEIICVLGKGQPFKH